MYTNTSNDTDWEEVVSSNVRRYKYSPDNKVLTVEFLSGGVYEYSGVSRRTYRALQRAESKGKFVNKFLVKKQVPYRRVN